MHSSTSAHIDEWCDKDGVYDVDQIYENEPKDYEWRDCHEVCEVLVLWTVLILVFGYDEVYERYVANEERARNPEECESDPAEVPSLEQTIEQ